MCLMKINDLKWNMLRSCGTKMFVIKFIALLNMLISGVYDVVFILSKRDT